MNAPATPTPFTPPPDCWRTIGIWGDGSCPLLPDLVHCHNCDVYIQSGRHRLEQPASEEYRRQWAEILARPKESQPINTTSVTVFRIGAHWLALPTTIFKQILEPRPIHHIPHRSNSVLLGIVPVQGELHLAFSMKELLSLKDGDTTTSQRAFPRMITIEKDGERWVFGVDEMHGLFELSPDASLPLTPTEDDPGSAYLTSMFELEGRVVNSVDEGLLFAGLKRSLL